MTGVRNTAIQLTLKARDLLSRVVKKSGDSLAALEQQGQSLKTRLKTLEQQSRLLASFKKQATSVQTVSRAYREAREKVERLAREQAQAVTPSKQLQRQLAAARKTVSGLSAQYQSQSQKLSSLRAELHKNGLVSRDLNRQQNRVQGELQQTAVALKKVQAQSRQTRNTVKRTGFRTMARDAEQAEGALGRLGSSLRNLVLAGTGLYALKRAMQSVLQTGDKYERLAIQMQALMGSVEAGQQATEWIKQFTKSTQLQLDQVTQAFVTLKNFGLDPMDGTLLALVDQNSKLGGEFERLQRISLALGQAFGKQKLQGEELRQLIEAGVPAWQLLEKATGENVQALRELSEKGQLGTEVIKALIAEMGSSSVGAAQKNMQTLSGLWSNMKDRFELFQKSIAESGWADYIKAQLATVGNRLDQLAANGKLQALATNIAATFIALAESLRTLFANLTIDGLVSTTTTGFQKIVDGASGVMAALKILTNGIQALFRSFTLVVKSWATLVTGSFTAAATAFAKMAEAMGFETLQARAEHFAGASKAVMDAFAQGVSDDAQTIRVAYSEIGRTLTTETPKVTDALALARASLESMGAGIEEANQKAADSQRALTQTTTEEVEKTKARQEELVQAVKKTGTAFEEVGDSAEQSQQQVAGSGSMAQAMATHWHALKDEMAALSPAALAAYEDLNGVGANMRTVTDDVEALRQELSQTRKSLGAMGLFPSGFDATGIGRWLHDTKRSSLLVKEAFLEQKLALETLMGAYDQGSLTAADFAAQAQAATHELDLLDDQDMGRLNRALEQAERTMESLGKSTRSTLDNLRNELDRLNGNTAAIEKRRYEIRKRQLEEQLEDAEQSGDGGALSNLQQALALNREVYNRTRSQRLERERKERQEQTAETARPSTPGTGSTITPTKVIRLDYPGGKVDVRVQPQDEGRLLRALQVASGRAT